MAATMSPWGSKPGAWALDAEEHDAELLKNQQDDIQNQQSVPTADFPSLSAAAATKPKKKKGQPISLAEFSAYGGPKPSSDSSKGLTTQDLMMLPTGPRERAPDELDRNRLGGGFKNYGSNGSYDRNSRYSSGEDSSSRWGSSSRVSDDSRRGGDGFNREPRKELGPSRADEIDDWAAAKKPTMTMGNGFERREKGGGFFDSHSSKADESDSWVSNKSFVPSEGRRSGGIGGGFDRERRGGAGFTSNGGGADSDSWGKRIEGGKIGTGERPRLNLQPRTLPVNNVQQEVSGAGLKPKGMGSNPFGDARPREEVLAEKGQDWKKIDEQLESTKIKDTAERGERPGGASFGRKGSGVGSGRAPEDRTERSWKRPGSAELESHPESAEGVEVEDGPSEEN